MGLMKELNALNDIYQKMYEGKATPESGTGKYYKEGQPTKQQLANRAKREKIKQLTNQGKHKEASALHNEDYETKKTKEVIGALDKEKPGKRKKTLSGDDKKKIAAKVVKDKGDTSKSDDRYAYEEVTPEIKKLIESGKFSEEEIKNIFWNEIDEDAQSDALAQMMGDGGDPQDDAIKQIVKAEKKAAKKKKVKSEGYQRNPEKGEAEERKAEKKRKASGAMPPRGDKRREDFEKWYAANVR